MWAETLKAVAALAWPILAGFVLLFFRKQAIELFNAAIGAVNRGSEIKIGIVSIGRSVGKLKVPLPADAL